VHNNFIKVVDMLVEARVGFGDAENPTRLDIVVRPGDLLVAHHGHGGTLAVFSAAEGFIEGLPDKVFFIIDFWHRFHSAKVFELMIIIKDIKCQRGDFKVALNALGHLVGLALGDDRGGNNHLGAM